MAAVVPPYCFRGPLIASPWHFGVMTNPVRQICALSFSAEASDRIELIPVGPFKTQDRRPVFTLADPAGVIARSFSLAAGGLLPIDFDHRSFGKPADTRAAGWISAMSVEGDRVMASVEWTAEGRAALESRAYRFLSPVFKTDRVTDEVLLIEGAGLVNYPALPELRQLASREDDMDLSEVIAGLLGLPVDNPDAIQGRITALLGAETQLASISRAAGVEGADAVTQICSRLNNAPGRPDPAQFAPMSIVNDLQRQLASLQDERNTSRVDDALEAARAAGKLVPSAEDWARQYASKDLEGFKTWVAAAPAVFTGKRIVAGDPPKADPSQLTREERQVCSQMGLDEAQFLATRNLAMKDA